MNRFINFAAGPAMLPTVVLERAQKEFLNWQDHGYSIVEANHRGPEFGELLSQVEAKTRDALAIPQNYRVLYLLAPARAHFAAIPLNLTQDGQTADYIITGLWSSLAAGEAEKYTQVERHENFNWNFNQDAAYVYYTDNETVNGFLIDTPDTHGVPRVVDMTSSLLTRPIDVNQYGLIFAGVQKNIAPSGLSIVIVRDDLLGRAREITPSVLDYTLQAEHHSLLNTSNNFSIYMTGLMLDWVQEQGGLTAIHARNQQKAARLYEFIDSSDFYQNQVSPPHRSILNVIFNLKDDAYNEAFLQQAKQAGMIGLKGHRKVGGMRASIYNAITLDDVDRLISHMREFAQSI